MRSGHTLRELDAGFFVAELDAILAVYAAAMGPPPVILPGRRAIMERHASNAAFRVIVATAGQQPAAPGHRGDAGPASALSAGGTVIAFAYGFRGAEGQWWHDLVRAALAVRYGHGSAQGWMGDSFEVAEVHVHPQFQGMGIGRAMMLALTGGCRERTAMLSTMDADSPARRLYRSLGFTDLLTAFQFPGGEPPYAVMGAALPLTVAARRSRHRRMTGGASR